MVKNLKELHNFKVNSQSVPSNYAMLSQSASTNDYIEKVAVCPSTYKQLFEPDGKKPLKNKRRLAIVKIQLRGSKHSSIWRVADTKGVTGISKDDIGLPFPALWEMNAKEPSEVDIEKGCFLPFYWYHPNHAARISTRLGIVAIVISIIGIVISVLF